MSALYLGSCLLGMLTLLFRFPAFGIRRHKPEAWTAYALINCGTLVVLVSGPVPFPETALHIALWSASVSGAVALATLYHWRPRPSRRIALRVLGWCDLANLLAAAVVARLSITDPDGPSLALIYVVPTVLGAAVFIVRCWRAARSWLACFSGAFALAALCYLLTEAFIPTTPLIALLARLPWSWLDQWRVFTRLRPLHRSLRSVNPHAVLVARHKRFDPYHRVRRAMLELTEWRWVLTARFDASVRDAADRLGRSAGLDGRELAAVVEAAQLRAAMASSTVRSDAASGPAIDGSGLMDECTWWTAVARAYRRSATVATACRCAAGGTPRGSTPPTPPS